jgi:hypothetical protein
MIWFCIVVTRLEHILNQFFVGLFLPTFLLVSASNNKNLLITHSFISVSIVEWLTAGQKGFDCQQWLFPEVTSTLRFAQSDVRTVCLKTKGKGRIVLGAELSTTPCRRMREVIYKNSSTEVTGTEDGGKVLNCFTHLLSRDLVSQSVSVTCCTLPLSACRPSLFLPVSIDAGEWLVSLIYLFIYL